MLYERLRFIREQNEMTQTDLAKKLGLTKSGYCRYENETDIIPIKHLIIISDFFNVSLDYIFSFSNEIKYKKRYKSIDKIKSGTRLKEFRKQQKYTQEQLANKLNIARTIISKYEKGEYLIATHTLYTICKKYNISADYLLGKSDFPIYLNSK